MGRKGFLQTVVWEEHAHNAEFEAECNFHGETCNGVDRLHFLSAPLNTLEDIRHYPTSYGGYCDLRPTSRTVVAAYITQDSVIRRDHETYAFLCCSMPRSVEITIAPGQPLFQQHVVTMPFVQKDSRGMMCAQAALMMLGEYWNYLRPNTFSTITSVEINKKAGVNPTDILTAKDGRGLTPQEMMTYLKSEGVPFMPLYYSNPAKSEADVDIYGFVESGLPVVLAVKTQSSAHALICLGHTYDRNSWSAMADVGYFNNLGHSQGKYHSNTAWIRNFLVHDDNLGPYYFMPTEKLKEILISGIVVLPDDTITTRPSEAADTAFSMLISNEFLEAIKVVLADNAFIEQNKFWIKEFVNHLKVACGDGLVLRSVLLSAGRISSLYSGHEFEDILTALVGTNKDRHLWYVELSWPDIYCHRQLNCGSVVIDPASKTVLYIHVPGFCATFSPGGITTFIAQGEDAPRQHYKRVVN